VKPTLVLLLRHALTPTTGIKLMGRTRGVHLSDKGRLQADAAARRLAALPKIGALYSSPLERARETAAPLARERGLMLRIERDLSELDMGQWAGISMKRAHRKPEWEIIQRHPSGFRFPDGESFVEMQARMTAAIGRLVAQHPGQVVVAVSHADPIKAAVAHALGTPLDLFQRIVIAPASITAVAYGRGGPAVITMNSVDGDLAGLVGS
jgi:probable phosphomutase (TIGR03848 family)